MSDNERKISEVGAGSSGKILLLEDDPYFMEFYRERFKRFGFEVCTEDDETEGMDMARTCLPDVIVLDISLPKEDDFGFIGEMKNYPELSGIPVVILTDLGDDENRNKGMSLGAREYLVRDEMTFADIAERIRLVAASSKK